MKTKSAITLVLLFILSGCGSKKISSSTDIKEKQDLELIDNSVMTSKVEQEKQYISTDITERIVTMYGVQFDTIYQDGKSYIIPIYYPVQKIEDRNINVENFIWRINTQDSIRNAVTLEFKGALESREKKITELKESTIIYQLALLILSIIGILILVLYIIAKVKKKSTGF